MAMNDLLSDLVARIKNGQRARLATINAPYSSLLASVLDVLKREGYIREYRKYEENKKSFLEIELKYHEGQPVIHEIKRISRPGRRFYSAISAMKPVHNGLGISVISTSRGVLSDYEARQQNIGGEVLCSVF